MRTTGVGRAKERVDMTDSILIIACLAAAAMLTWGMHEIDKEEK